MMWPKRLHARALVILDIVAGRVGTPVVHENGFIVLPLVEPDDRFGRANERLHVWPDGPIVKQATDSPIHDHRFSFESIVLCGRLTHVEYKWTPGECGTHIVHEVVDGPEHPGLLSQHEFGVPTVVSKVELPAGGQYFFASKVFHESRGTGLTATWMRKLINHPEHRARVLCPAGQPPDNDFRRGESNDPELLWRYIDRAILLVGMQ